MPSCTKIGDGGDLLGPLLLDAGGPVNPARFPHGRHDRILLRKDDDPPAAECLCDPRDVGVPDIGPYPPIAVLADDIEHLVLGVQLNLDDLKRQQLAQQVEPVHDIVVAHNRHRPLDRAGALNALEDVVGADMNLHNRQIEGRPAEPVGSAAG